MTLIRRSAADLAAMPATSLVEAMMRQMVITNGRRVSTAESRSWESSVPILARELVAAGLGDVEVLLEHHLPLSSQRMDAVLAGVHPRTGRASFVVVELKQWSKVALFEDDPVLVDVAGMSGPPKLHPVAQVQGYCRHLLDFVRALDDEDAVTGVAYLHNALEPADVAGLRRYPTDRHGVLYTGAERQSFHDHLRTRLAPHPGRSAADLLLSSPVAPSKQLLAVAAAEVRNREQFVLLDDQRRAVEIVHHEVRKAAQSDHKRIVVVTGGPGSGKSVVALSLLGELSREGRTVLHATGSRSFTQTLRKVAGTRQPRVQKMFKYFNQFMTAERNSLDVLVLDEAHRIRQTSVNRYTKAELRTDRAQVDELIDAARVPVFLLDEHQVVRPGEMGSLDVITAHAKRRGLDVMTVQLEEQFRCGGSLAYVQWVERFLGLRPGGPVPWDGDPALAVVVAGSPIELEQRLAESQAAGYSARMSAGYCWPWSDPRADGSLVPDVQIGEWARPWNLKGDRSVGGAPPSALWASDPRGFGQVGCVYTAQGFEYDWNGVILGPDLVVRDGSLTTVRAANKDPDFRSRTRVDDRSFDLLVRNVYKVLLTRGMVGTVLYSTDPETRDLLRRLIT